MPPRSRTQTPTSRRPRVAGLRNPGRHQDVDESVTPGSPTTEPDPVTSSTAPSSASAPPRTDEPTETGPATVSFSKAGRSPQGTEQIAEQTTETATAPAPEKDSEPDTEQDTAAAPPTPAARPTPTGRARTERRRPAPATGAASTEERGRGSRAAGSKRGSGRTRPTRPARGPRRPLPKWAPVALGVLVVLLLAVAGVAGWFGYEAWTTGPVANSAVIDAATTADAVGQTRQAVEQVFSFDPAKIDDSANAARNLGTGDFPREYLQVFDQTVRPGALAQGLRQTASVLDIGVRSIDGDRANVIVLIQLDVQRATTGQSTTTPGLLNVDLQRVDGRWKVAKVSPLTGQG